MTAITEVGAYPIMIWFAILEWWRPWRLHFAEGDASAPGVFGEYDAFSVYCRPDEFLFSDWRFRIRRKRITNAIHQGYLLGPGNGIELRWTALGCGE